MESECALPRNLCLVMIPECLVLGCLLAAKQSQTQGRLQFGALRGKWDEHAAAIVSVLSFELTVHGEPFAAHDLCS